MTFQHTPRPGSAIPSAPGTPYFIEKGHGDRALLFNDLFTVYAGAEQTENTFNFFTCDGAQGDLIPSHVHANTYEVFFITAGAVRLFVEDTSGEQHEKLLTVGDFGFVPKNCPHAYRVERHHSQIVGVAAGPLGTFERFFENLGVPTDALTLPTQPAVPAPQKFGTIPMQFDVSFLPDHRWHRSS
jgi:quercetin 2,3-dioxygenase